MLDRTPILMDDSRTPAKSIEKPIPKGTPFSIEAADFAGEGLDTPGTPMGKRNDSSFQRIEQENATLKQQLQQLQQLRQQMQQMDNQVDKSLMDIEASSVDENKQKEDTARKAFEALEREKATLRIQRQAELQQQFDAQVFATDEERIAARKKLIAAKAAVTRAINKELDADRARLGVVKDAVEGGEEVINTSSEISEDSGDLSAADLEFLASGDVSNLSASFVDKKGDDSGADLSLSQGELKKQIAKEAATPKAFYEKTNARAKQHVVVDKDKKTVTKFESTATGFRNALAFFENEKSSGVVPKLLETNKDNGKVVTEYLDGYMDLETYRNVLIDTDERMKPEARVAFVHGLIRAYKKLSHEYSDLATLNNIVFKVEADGKIDVKFIEGGKADAKTSQSTKEVRARNMLLKFFDSAYAQGFRPKGKEWDHIVASLV